MPKLPKTGLYSFFFAYLAALYAINNWISREETLPLLVAYSSLFVVYLLLLKCSTESKALLALGIIARVSLFFSLPSLSDDIYRFIWDGNLLANGVDPYAQLPSYYLGKAIPGINEGLYQKLNSPGYFSVYPPLNQSFFWMAAFLAQGSWLAAANVLRVPLLLADLTSFLFLKKLLVRYRKPSFLAHAYWLNPLVVLEGTGNLHFEVLVVCFLIMGLYFFERNKKWLSGIAFGLSIGTKLLPLIYLPLIFLKGIKNKNYVTALFASVIAVLTFLPLLSSTTIQGMSKSLDLYFHSFEFNGSLYYLAREIGYWIYGYNAIGVVGTLMGICSLLAILTLSIWASLKKRSVAEGLLFILFVYVLFATTVHPWYIVPLIAFGLIAGYWYPVLWSFLIFLTYAGYHPNGFELPSFVLVMEYVPVILLAIWELRASKDETSKKPPPSVTI